MTLKRVQVQGYIELPDKGDLPEEGSILTVGKMRLEVTGFHRDKQKRRKDQVEWVYTAPTTLLEGATISKIEPPAGDEKLPLEDPEEPPPVAEVTPIK